MFFTHKNIISLSFILLAVFIFAGCSEKKPGEIKTIIKGSFTAFKGKLVSLSEFDINNAIPLDTAIIDKEGSFRFNFRRTGPGFYLIKLDNKNYLTLALDKEKKVEVYSDASNLRKDYHVKGSADSELYREFEMNLESNRNKVDSLTWTYKEHQRSSAFHSVKARLDSQYQEIFNLQRQFSIGFLEENCSSLTSLLVINKRFGERKILTEGNDLEYFMMIDSCLSLGYPENKFLKELKKQIVIFKDQRKIFEMTEQRLSTGNKIPDISLQNPSGKYIQLHSFLGKPVVLYFWASWDQPSRQANKKVKEIVGKAGKSRPVVYAIGLESYREAWEKAIVDDGLQDWTHVTDYLNIHSSAKTMFNIPDDFPYFFVLDEQLNIRYKGSDFQKFHETLSQLQQ
jgi:thiol-disulfide isomerase/thioredoxin